MSIKITKEVRIMFTGGGTGGHFYPLFAVHDYLEKIGEGNLIFSYTGPVGIFGNDFNDRGIKVYSILSSKVRRYFDLNNFIDVPKFFISLAQALIVLYHEMPDAVFSKGGPGSFPVILAAWFYQIPVMIHESDAILSLTNKLSAKFAKRIAASFQSVVEVLPKEKTVVTGNPVRSIFLKEWGNASESKPYFNFENELPMLLVLGGSQGSQRINNFVIDNLDILLENVQICHQVGMKNFKQFSDLAKVAVEVLPYNLKKRYAVKSYMEEKEMRVALNAADVVLSRSGAGAIFEIAVFGKPSILVPLKDSANNHQRANAYEYVKTGAAFVLEEENLKPHLLLDIVKKITENREKGNEMRSAALRFSKPEAAETIGKEILGMVGIWI